MENDVVPSSANSLLSRKNLTVTDVEGWVDIPAGTSHLVVNHAMDNRLLIDADNDGQVDDKNEAFDMSPYVFVVRLHLDAAGEETKFDRTVTITQYPAMYVTSIQSNGSVWVNGYGYGKNPNGTDANTYTDSQNLHYSFVYNSGNGTNQNNDQIGSVSLASDALSTQANNNGYNMVVHPTILDDALKLVLGDSRVSTGGTLSNIDGLTKYRASRTDVNSIVSPGFMIASSYGKTLPLADINRAKERCASYQENGYPAGRWRVPTEGEIEFLVQLSNNKFIPSLFEGRYWAASGRYFSSTNNSFGNYTGGYGINAPAVRCVYDVWYWGEEPYQKDATTWLGFQDK